MKQLSLRGFDAELERCIRELARKGKMSLNRATIKLLRKGAGLEKERPSKVEVGDSLDHLIGTWSADEARELLRGIRPLEKIDRTFWK